jgi:hypothetical protein
LSVEHVCLDEVRLAGLVGLQAGGDHHHLTPLPKAVSQDEVASFAHDRLEATPTLAEQGIDTPA